MSYFWRFGCCCYLFLPFFSNEVTHLKLSQQINRFVSLTLLEIMHWKIIKTKSAIIPGQCNNVDTNLNKIPWNCQCYNKTNWPIWNSSKSCNSLQSLNGISKYFPHSTEERKNRSQHHLLRGELINFSWIDFVAIINAFNQELFVYMQLLRLNCLNSVQTSLKMLTFIRSDSQPIKMIELQQCFSLKFIGTKMSSIFVSIAVYRNIMFDL